MKPIDNKERIRILLADDHIVVRMGIASLISYEQDMIVVGEADDGLEAIRLAGKQKPDVVIMDLMMPRMNGVEATKAILRENSTARILILTTFGSSSEVFRALDVGAQGVLLKSSSRDELISAIHAVHAGKRVICPELECPTTEPPPAPCLSERQLEVLTLTAKGFSNNDIGKILGISVNSVKDHLKLIYSRLNVSTRAEATAFAVTQGWINC